MNGINSKDNTYLILVCDVNRQIEKHLHWVLQRTLRLSPAVQNRNFSRLPDAPNWPSTVLFWSRAYIMYKATEKGKTEWRVTRIGGHQNITRPDCLIVCVHLHCLFSLLLSSHDQSSVWQPVSIDRNEQWWAGRWKNAVVDLPRPYWLWTLRIKS